KTARVTRPPKNLARPAIRMAIPEELFCCCDPGAATVKHRERFCRSPAARWAPAGPGGAPSLQRRAVIRWRGGGRLHGATALAKRGPSRRRGPVRTVLRGDLPVLRVQDPGRGR